MGESHDDNTVERADAAVSQSHVRSVIPAEHDAVFFKKAECAHKIHMLGQTHTHTRADAYVFTHTHTHTHTQAHLVL